MCNKGSAPRARTMDLLLMLICVMIIICKIGFHMLLEEYVHMGMLSAHVRTLSHVIPCIDTHMSFIPCIDTHMDAICNLIKLSFCFRDLLEYVCIYTHTSVHACDCATAPGIYICMCIHTHTCKTIVGLCVCVCECTDMHAYVKIRTAECHGT
jgi:hypothetical protein